MLRRRKLTIAAVTMASMAAVLGLAALPDASANGCTVVITVAGGQTFTFENVPPGTPPSSLPLPVSLPIVNVSQSCPPVTATTPAPTVTATTPPAQTTSTSTSTSTSTTSKPKRSSGSGSSSSRSSTSTTTTKKSSPKPASRRSRKGSGQKPTPLNPGSAQAGSNLKQPASKPTAKKRHKKGHKKAKPRTPPPPVTKSGVPTPANPTFSYALPGPAPIGVPNFFIESFQIPPFLLPIYQAAGIQYDVPWQVLAAINEIETDYGRNLSVSTAGAVGWMQFMPSTWKRYGVDANGDGIADPYNPADAIFSAARYLHAAGASKSIQNAVFAYNHAWWYVQSVLLRAQLIGGMPKGFINSVTGLVQGHFPVAAPAKYADDAVLKLAKTRVKNVQRRGHGQVRPDQHRHRDLRQAGLAGHRGQRRQGRQDRAEQAARALHRAPGRHRQHLHVRKPGLDPQAVPGAQAGQGDGELDRQGAARAGCTRPHRTGDRRYPAGAAQATPTNTARSEHGQAWPKAPRSPCP